MGVAHWVQYLRGAAVHESSEVGGEEAEEVDWGMIHDDWRRMKVKEQEADLGLHGLGTN